MRSLYPIESIFFYLPPSPNAYLQACKSLLFYYKKHAVFYNMEAGLVDV